ncbi:MAG TPA: hypothetical protein VFJ85_02965 [Acidimicrobiales bacterium]|nr:hypothetical protein [Acidimicrobiales bacterium]
MTGQALERVHPAAPALPTESEIRGLESQARAIAVLDNRVKAIQDPAERREIAFALALTLWNYAVPATPVNSKKLHLIPGRNGFEVFESAQLLLGLLAMHGIPVRPITTTDTLAVVRGRRPGDDEDGEFTYDIEMARRSEALDEWVERKYRNQGDRYDRTEKLKVAVDGVPVDVPLPEWAAAEVAAGHVKHNDYWFKYRADALLNRAVRRLAKFLGADALLGLSPLGDEPAHIAGRPDDIEADVIDVDDAAPAPCPAYEGPDPAAALRNERGRIWGAVGRIPDGQWRAAWAKAWRDAGLPAHHELGEEHLDDARRITRCYLALASLDVVGLSSRDDRHDFVSAATNGETESTKNLSAEQLHAVLGAVRHRANQLAEAAEPPAEEEPDYGPDGEPF